MTKRTPLKISRAAAQVLVSVATDDYAEAPLVAAATELEQHGLVSCDESYIALDRRERCNVSLTVKGAREAELQARRLAAGPDMAKYTYDYADLLEEVGATEATVPLDALRELCAAYQDMQRLQAAKARLRKYRLQAIMDIDMLADACGLDVSEYPAG